MALKLRLSQRALLCVILPLGLQICFFAILAVVLQIAERQASDEYREKETIGHCNWLSVLDLAGNLAAVAHSIDSDPFFLEKFHDAQKAAEKECKSLKELFGPNDPFYNQSNDRTNEQASNQVQELQSKTATLFKQLDESVQKGSIASFNTQQLKSLWLQLATARFKLLSAERIHYQMNAYSIPRVRSFILYTVIFLAVADLFMGFILVLLFNRHISTRLSILMDNTMKFASGINLNPVFGGADELGELDATFHSMADEVRAAQQALSESEERMRLVVNNVQSGLLAVDNKYVVQTANPAAGNLLQQERDRLSGRNMADLLGLSNTELSKTIAQALEKPTELTLTLPSGERLPVEVAISEFSQGGQTLMLVNLRDLTDRYEAERLKREFLGMVGHDLKSPLTIIENLCDLLPSGVLGQLNEQGTRMNEIATAQVERLSRLVSDLTDVANIESNTFSLNKKNLSLLSLAEQARDAVSNQAEQKHIAINIENADYWVSADDVRIVQVIVNLLGNALKFSPEGKAITISAQKEEQGQQQTILVKVTDQGRGVPEEHKQRIFDRFQQVSREDSRLKGGLSLGLGLAICKVIIQQHGGTIGVDSQVGQGSTFWFRLPAGHPES